MIETPVSGYFLDTVAQVFANAQNPFNKLK